VSIRIGLLLGELQGSRGPWYDIWNNCLQLCISEARESGELVQPVDLIWENVNGLPWGSAHEVVVAWERLRDAGAIAILGPSNADNCMSIRSVANESRVPTFVFGCSHQLASEWTFSPSWGSAPVDAMLAMNWVASRGYRRAVVLADRAWHATEWLEFLDVAARRYSVQLVGTERIELFSEGLAPQLADARARVKRLQNLEADVLVMACSVAAGAAALAVKEADWEIPKVKAGAAFGGAPEWEGWVGTAIYDEANPRYVDWRDAYSSSFGAAPTGSLLDMALSFTDALRALIVGIQLAPIHNRHGLKDGLERVKMLPAVAGGPTTMVTFGPHDHRAYKGRDSSVLQRYVGPGAGDFEFEGYFDSSI
jgi:hypothetical protein